MSLPASEGIGLCWEATRATGAAAGTGRGGGTTAAPHDHKTKPPFWQKKSGKIPGVWGQSPQQKRREATVSSGGRLFLEFRRRAIAQGGVKPCPIVDVFQELADARASFLKIAIFVAKDLLVLQGFDERFAGRIYRKDSNGDSC